MAFQLSPTIMHSTSQAARSSHFLIVPHPTRLSQHTVSPSSFSSLRSTILGLSYALARPQSLPFSGIESISKHHPKLFCCQCVFSALRYSVHLVSTRT